jgi:suppressor of fused-like protein
MTKTHDGDPSGEDAPGWSAIEQAVASLVAGQEPLHWGTGNLPDQDGLYGLNAYQQPDGWLLVTLGLSELFDKISENPATSGWGFELTMRTPADGNPQPPTWALTLLATLGNYVYNTRKPFAEGHRMSPGGPITGGMPATQLVALAFTADPQLAAVDTPNGRLEFLTVIGITDHELQQMKETSTSHVIGDLKKQSPLLLTDPNR